MSDFKAQNAPKIDFGWGSAPDSAGPMSLQLCAPPDLLGGIKGTYF